MLLLLTGLSTIGLKYNLWSNLNIRSGINVEELSNGKRRLFGDVNFDEAKEVAGYITPVPGGLINHL